VLFSKSSLTISFIGQGLGGWIRLHVKSHCPQVLSVPLEHMGSFQWVDTPANTPAVFIAEDIGPRQRAVNWWRVALRDVILPPQ
jgi:hypothetical protein